MQLSIRHETRFIYDAPAHYALVQLRMRPQTGPTQTVKDWSLSLDGARHHAQFVDAYGTLVDLIELEPDAQEIDIHVSGEVETISRDGVYGDGPSCVPLWHYCRTTPLTQSHASMRTGLLDSADRDDVISQLHALSAHIRDKVSYEPGQTHVGTTATEAFDLGKGVCQDHAHIFLALARSMNIPARYVSGYLMMDDRIDQDASHAWVEAHIKDLGWVGFDVSNGISPDERYIKIGHGLDYMDCAPTRGMTVGGTKEQLKVSIQVQQ
jgi:transglutaminase-like putative cysteine protease